MQAAGHLYTSSNRRAHYMMQHACALAPLYCCKEFGRAQVRHISNILAAPLKRPALPSEANSCTAAAAVTSSSDAAAAAAKEASHLYTSPSPARHFTTGNACALAAAWQHATVACTHSLTQPMYKVTCMQKSSTQPQRQAQTAHED